MISSKFDCLGIVLQMNTLHRAYASVILKLEFQGGITEEQMLKFMGANTQLNSLQAKELLEVLQLPPPMIFVIEQIHA